MEHKLGMNCMASGTVLIRIRLDKGGYVPGEKIHIWASIDNQSGALIKSTQAVLTEVSASEFPPIFRCSVQIIRD
jgi:hypothetical protein